LSSPGYNFSGCTVQKANLTQKLWERLSPQQERALRALLSLAPEAPIYLVGGAVRDLLLGLPSIDLDLVVEGDAPALAISLAEALSARAVVHRRFGTATVRGRDFHVDLATARAESYPRPGALPSVRPASIAEDLARRDFTINAMALGLAGPHRERLLDPHGGQADLEAGLLRVLHEASFRDDATRILRAARYAARLSFRIEELTLAWLRRDLHYLDTISGPRLRHELLRCLQEERPEEALLVLAELGVLARLHPSLSFDAAAAGALARARREAGREASPLLGLAMLGARLQENEALAVASRLALTRAERQVLLAMARLRALAPELASPERAPSHICALLDGYPPAALWAYAFTVDNPLTRQRVLDYLRQWRHRRPHLTGRDLANLGVPPGPAMGRVLAHLRDACRDGRVRTRQEEVELVRSLLAGGLGS
jgi:tRNA nucleotidyltransferase (CCA-adding enzyme)